MTNSSRDTDKHIMNTFVAEKIRGLRRFEIYWEDMHEVRPTEFPAFLTNKEWENCYLDWKETVDK